jgi:hypothetical protein
MTAGQCPGPNLPYHKLCREERAYAAVLYALLCRQGNLENFIGMCGVENVAGDVAPAPYFEFAYLRDWWHKSDPVSRREWLLLRLPETLRAEVESALLRTPDNYLEVNRCLGVAGPISKRELQMPGRWSVAKLARHSDDDFRRLCWLKWAFNIKPDILVDLGDGRVICVEIKVCSGPGSYPVAGSEKSLLKRCEPRSVGQVDLQRYMLAELLGYRTTMVSLTLPTRSGEAKADDDCGTEPLVCLTWRKVLDGLAMDGMPANVLRMIEWVRAAEVPC